MKTALILLNGKVLRAAAAPGAVRPVECAVAIENGRVAALGEPAAARAGIGGAAEVIDLQGRFLFPGFRDAHLHPLMGGVAMAECLLRPADSAAASLALVAAYARRHAARPFIRGSGWHYEHFPGGLPERAALDQVVPDRPAYLVAVDGHAAWVNSRALEAAGITSATPDPPGGKIVRRSQDGSPAGLLCEPAAMNLVAAGLPPVTAEELREGYLLFQEQALGLGLTAAQEAMAFPEYLQLYDRLAETGELKLRLSAFALCTPETGAAPALNALAAAARRPRERFRARGGKFFLDGVTENHTAWLLEPYADRPGDRGLPLWEEERLFAAAVAINRAGGQLHFHAVGDAAVRQALAACAQVREQGAFAAPPIIAHCDLVAAADLPRFAELGCRACMQPAWFFRDTLYPVSTLPFLGEARAARLYPWRRLRRAGAEITCGSDWPVGGEIVTMNPLEAMQIGLTRQGPAGKENALGPEERATLEELLLAFCGRSGVEEGQPADLVVLDQDLFMLPPGELRHARVLMTICGGSVAWRSPAPEVPHRVIAVGKNRMGSRRPLSGD